MTMSARPKLRKDVKQFLDEIESEGWSFVEVTRGSHIRLSHVDGASYCMAATPSDWRNLRNTRSDLRRAVRARENANT